jgi:hypothetical protein
METKTTTKTSVPKLNSTLEQHYWNSNGVYQEQYDALWKSLVPDSGESSSIQGEMIRCIGRLYYDFCNNGNCNAIDVRMEDCDSCEGSGYEEDADGDEQDCGWCGGDCQVEGDYYVTEYYDEMLSFLEANMSEKQLVQDLREWMVNDYQKRYSFSDEQMSIYDKVVDSIVYLCLTTPLIPNPNFKNN